MEKESALHNTDESNNMLMLVDGLVMVVSRRKCVGGVVQKNSRSCVDAIFQLTMFASDFTFCDWKRGGSVELRNGLLSIITSVLDI